MEICISNTRGQIQNTVGVKVAIIGSALTSEWLPWLLDSAFRLLVQQRRYTCAYDCPPDSATSLTNPPPAPDDEAPANVAGAFHFPRCNLAAVLVRSIGKRLTFDTAAPLLIQNGLLIQRLSAGISPLNSLWLRSSPCRLERLASSGGISPLKPRPLRFSPVTRPSSLVVTPYHSLRGASVSHLLTFSV